MKGQTNPAIFGILAAIAIVAGSGATYFQVLQRSEEVKTITELKSSLRDEKKIRTELDLGNQKLRESSEKLNHLEEGVPVMAYVPTMLTELEIVGKQCGIKVTGVKPKEEKKAKSTEKDEDGESKGKAKQPYQDMVVEVKGLGTFRSAMSFVEALEAFPKIVGIHSLGLVPKRDRTFEAGPPQLELTVEIRAYVFPLSEPATSTKTAQTTEREGNRHENG